MLCEDQLHPVGPTGCKKICPGNCLDKKVIV
jgi:hypothetical protein